MTRDGGKQGINGDQPVFMVIKKEYMVLCPSKSFQRANSYSRQELYKHNALCEYKFREGQKAVQSEQPFTVQAIFFFL